MSNLHQKVRAARLLRGLSQPEVAERAFIHPKTYGRKESGQSPITEEELEHIARSLDCAPDDIRRFDLERNRFPEAGAPKPDEVASLRAEIKSLHTLLEYIARHLPGDWKARGGGR